MLAARVSTESLLAYALDGEAPAPPPQKEKNPVAVALGKLRGAKEVWLAPLR